MFDVMNFVSANMVIVVLVLYILGTFLKAIPGSPSWIIPFVLVIIGMIFGWFIVSGIQGIIQGILCAGVAVLTYQLIKQGIEGVQEIKKDVTKSE